MQLIIHAATLELNLKIVFCILVVFTIHLHHTIEICSILIPVYLEESVETVNEVSASEGVSTNAHAKGLFEANLGSLMNGLDVRVPD